MSGQDERQELLTHKRRLQMDMAIKSSELKKFDQEKIQLEIEIRQNQRKSDLLQMQINQARLQVSKLDNSKVLLEKEIKKLKREISDTRIES